MKVQTLLALLLLVIVGCGKTETATKQDVALLGTRQLVGFGNSNGNIREVQPVKCEKCYTIVFGKDNTLKGHSFSNEMTGKYNVDLEKK